MRHRYVLPGEHAFFARAVQPVYSAPERILLPASGQPIILNVSTNGIGKRLAIRRGVLTVLADRKGVEEFMSSSYPRFRTWPYLFVAMFVFTCIVVPSRHWLPDAPTTANQVTSVVQTSLHVLTITMTKQHLGKIPLLSRMSTSIRKPGLTVNVRPISVPSTPDAVAKAKAVRANLPLTRSSRPTPWEAQPIQPRGARDASVTPPRHRTLPGMTSGAAELPVETPWSRPTSWDAELIQPLHVETHPPVSRKIDRRDTLDDLRIQPLQAEVEPHEIYPTPSITTPESDEHEQQLLSGPEIHPVPEPPLGQPSIPTQLADSPIPAAQDGVWPRCSALLEMIDHVSAPELANWAHEIRSICAELEGQKVDGNQAQIDAIIRLRQLSELPSVTKTLAYDDRQKASLVSYAVRRRADVWLPVARLADARSMDSTLVDTMRPLADSVLEVGEFLDARSNGASWRAFLGLEPLMEALEQGDVAKTTELGEDLLFRAYSPQLDANQAAFVTRPVFQALVRDIRELLASQVSPTDLLRNLEDYETEPNREHSIAVIEDLRRWQSSSDPSIFLPTVQAIKKNYRNANLRIAVSENLINRMIPAIHNYADQVNDTILGAEVRGQNSTSTVLSVAMIPDPQRIRLRLNAQGTVHSNTTSYKGPVTMFNRGESTFTADKQLIVQPNGIFVTKTQAAANTGNRLLGMRTDLDQIPIIGWVVRSMARRQHDEQRPLVWAEITRRVQRSASQKIDREVQQRLADVEHRVSERVVEPLRDMALDPKAIEMRTTADRAILRARLASPLQFGAHSPRPQARKDSVMSIQIHQTAANNLIEQLDLHGKRMTLKELVASLSAQLGMNFEVPNEEHNDVIVQFADEHPFEFEFNDGRITLTLHFAELDNGRRKWKNFSARGYYRADVQQLDLEMIRDEGIELISDRLRLRDQLALRSIFTKVLARNHRLDVLRQAITQQPKLRSLVVTQLTVRDGWLAVALGEETDGIRMVEKSHDLLR